VDRIVYIAKSFFVFKSLVAVSIFSRVIMDNKAKIQYLVVDTSAFIKNVALQVIIKQNIYK
jgi:hypothetical protein